MIGGEAHVHIAQIADGADEEAGRDDQQQAEADLQRDAGAAEFEGGAEAGVGLLLERFDQAGIPELRGRSQREEQAGEQGGGEGEEQHAPVQRAR